MRISMGVALPVAFFTLATIDSLFFNGITLQQHQMLVNILGAMIGYVMGADFMDECLEDKEFDKISVDAYQLTGEEIKKSSICFTTVIFTVIILSGVYYLVKLIFNLPISWLFFAYLFLSSVVASYLHKSFRDEDDA